ncbi:phage tail protein [Vibrio parahaemolyticus]|nr:phage tail protein [Vibrio parahaemolyticus]
MASKYSAVITNLGASLIESAFNSGTTVDISKMALGDSSGSYVAPDPSFTGLVSEFGRVDVNDGAIEGHLIHVYVYVSSEYDGKTVREFGLFDTSGNMIVYASHPDSLISDDGTGEMARLEIECIIDIESSEVVNLIVNPIYPSATTTESGITRLNSSTTSDSETEAATPKAVKIAKTAADNAQSTADDAIPQVGGSTITNQDWDTITSPGAYAVSGASGNEKPPAYNYGTLFVLNTKTTIVQIYYSDQAFQMLSRAKWSSNNWGSWEHVGGASQSPNSALNLNTNNLNSLDGSASYTTAQFGFFYQDKTANATTERNYPEQEAGMLIISKSAMIGGSGCIQTYITRSNNIYTRSKYSSWSDWVKVYSTKNKPTPDDIGALKGQTVVASWANDGSWIKIASAYLPSNSSVAKIDIYGGAGFNELMNQQSSKHQIIVRAGNSQGTGNCRLYTQALDTCPFDAIGFVHTGSSQFDIYGKSRSNYSKDLLVEYAATHTITPKNEVLSEIPLGLYEGDVVIDYNSYNPPTIEDIAGLDHLGKTAIGTSVMAVDFESESYQEYYDYGDDDFNLVSFDPSKYETQIYYDGYYLVDVLTMRGAIVGTAVAGINVTVKVNDVEYMHGFVSTEDATGRNPIQMRRVIKLLSGDKVRVYSDQDAQWLDGGSIEFQYLRPLAATKKTKDNPKLTIEKQPKLTDLRG